MRSFIRGAVLAVLLAVAASAQAAVTNCTGGGAAPNRCTAITDPFPSTTIQPVTCKIYIGTFVLASAPVVGPAGGLYCAVALPTMAAGNYTLTATAVGTDGVESPVSAGFTFTVGIPVVTPPLGAPTNLRVTSP